MRNAQSSLAKNRGVLTIAVILAISAVLVYASFYPDIPRIKQINEIPRQTGGGYSEPIVSTPQIAIVPTPTPNVENIIPPEEKAESGALNTVAAVSLAILGSFGMYLLFKYRQRVARHVFSIFILFLAIVTSYFFVGKIIDMLEFSASVQLENWLKLFIMVVPTFFSIFTAKILLISGSTEKMKRFINILTGTLAGSFVVTVVPFYINILFSIFIALYDLYAVRWGAVKSLVKIDGALATVVAFEDHGRSFGLGDVIVYAMLPSSCLTYAMLYLPRYAFYGLSPLLDLLVPWLIFITVALSVVFGIILTLKLLEKREMMPGLTIPVLTGSCAFGLCILAMQYANYAGWGWFVPIL